MQRSLTEMSEPKLKTSKSRNDTAVQGTNDSSIVSKCSMVERGYFNDEFLKVFVAKISRRAPLLHRGYYVRAKAMDHIFRCFLSEMAGKKCQIISLGAGFDSSYFRIKALGLLDQAVFVDVDFLPVMERKMALIRQSRDLEKWLSKDKGMDESLQNHLVLNTEDYKMLGIDLTSTPLLTASLKKLGIDFECPTLLLSEVVITYMGHKSSSKVINWASDTFDNAAFVAYEQVFPDDAFGRVMMAHFLKLGSPLRSIGKYPTPQSQMNRYIEMGWTECNILDMNQFYTTVLDKDERERVESIEPFGEYEEWHLKCAHYILLGATQGSCVDFMDNLIPNKLNTHQDIKHSYDSKPFEKESECESLTPVQHGNANICEAPLKVYGHSATVLDGNMVLVIGGFGEQNKRHHRFKDILLCDIRKGVLGICKKYPIEVGNEDGLLQTLATSSGNGESKETAQGNGNKERVSLLTDDLAFRNSMERIHHTVTNIGDKQFVLFGGRISPAHACESVCLLEFSNKNNKSDATCDVIQEQLASVKVDENGHTPNSLHQWCCKCYSIQADGEKPCPRWRHTAVLVTIDGKKCLFIHGGRNVEQSIMDDSYILDIESWSWKKIPAKDVQPIARHSHTADVWNDSVIVCCGLGDDLQPLNSVFSFSLTNQEWKIVDMHGSLLPRYSHSSHIVGDILYLVGGVNFTSSGPGIAKIDLKTGGLKEFPLPAQHPAAPLMLHNHESVMTSDNEIIILGGGGNCFSFGTHFNKSPIQLSL